MYCGYYEEDDKCPECDGVLKYNRPEDEEGNPKSCSCHINPPCSSCTDKVLTCNKCKWEEDAPDHKDIMVAPGLSMREYKPKPLDKTKIDYRSKGHSSSSMKVEGVYPEGTTREEVKAKVNGTFGGRFQQFGEGHFTFIAYTD